jgi:hypothetical protein
MIKYLTYRLSAHFSGKLWLVASTKRGQYPHIALISPTRFRSGILSVRRSRHPHP